MKSVTRARKPFYLTPTADGENLATNWRNEGKLLFEQGKLFEALEAYNKSLCVAQFGSIDIPLAFAGRSAVYFEAQEYQLSLDNIKLALDHDLIPADQRNTLNQREVKCKVLIESQQKSDDDDPWTFFKLSYPPSEKIPFIVNCLELQNSEEYGRFLITTQDLNPGDVIAIEEPFVKIVHSESAHTRCANCLKSNKMSLIPSQTGQTAMFCSTSCLETATHIFLHPENVSRMHDIKQRMLFEALAVCGGSFERLKELMDDTELTKKTIFDFDLSNSDDPLYKYNLLLSINSLVQASKVSEEVVRYLSNHPVLDTLQSQAEKDIAKDFLVRSFKILTVNSFGIEWVVPAKPTDLNKDSVNTKLAGDGLCQFGSLMNHSCSPNIDRLFVDNKFVFYVRRPILKGQQLFTCYGTLFLDAPRELRQETLQDEYGFLCSCEACYGDYPSAVFYPWTDVPIVITERSKTIEWKQQFKKNCNKIIKGQTTLSHSEMCVIMLKNLYYLVAIAKTEPFIF